VNALGGDTNLRQTFEQASLRQQATFFFGEKEGLCWLGEACAAELFVAASFLGFNLRFRVQIVVRT
jgi:hypothetical protein